MTVAMLACALVLAGCTGDDGEEPDAGNDADGLEDGAGMNEGSSMQDGGGAYDAFEPQEYSWDGMIPIHVCIADGAGGACIDFPMTERDDSRSFEVEGGASLAAFEFRWDDSGVDFIIQVSGVPAADDGEYVGPSPFRFEVPLEGPGSLAVSVSDHGHAGTSGHLQGNDAPFRMELTIS